MLQLKGDRGVGGVLIDVGDKHHDAGVQRREMQMAIITKKRCTTEKKSGLTFNVLGDTIVSIRYKVPIILEPHSTEAPLLAEDI